MKKIAKKNQIVIATLAVMIAAAGYMNYSGKLFPNKTKTQETNSELANKELLETLLPVPNTMSLFPHSRITLQPAARTGFQAIPLSQWMQRNLPLILIRLQMTEV